ncbi:Uma2 family endonuclease [Nostoc sp. TCL26-01]|uniref:Uma2 family endonuclease n=1 Tax=Nostoc sp. TCL26-01 TaxID=2576904 RepID=UPI0015B95757|nr:Uma2 family endonuclease [Nostoc sp. TCL26-01]QLE56357.1 Uma2 family endonuclease [Nostoc sp. TCL26-01]
MIAQVDESKYYTSEEYLELEVNSQERHEYIDGEIIVMTGGTPNHNKIALNLSAALNFAMKRQPYQVFVTDQRLWIPAKGIYTYPDVMVVDGEPQLQTGRKDTITNPLIIAEVLSNSTKSYDKDDKFAAYRTLANFQEYILIDQYKMHIEQYFKTDNKRWIFVEYDDLDETISLNSITFTMAIADIYDKVNFAQET